VSGWRFAGAGTDHWVGPGSVTIPCEPAARNRKRVGGGDGEVKHQGNCIWEGEAPCEPRVPNGNPRFRAAKAAPPVHTGGSDGASPSRLESYAIALSEAL